MSNKTLDSFEFMLENRKVISEVVGNAATFAYAWEVLQEKFPKITEVVKFNTFRTYVKFVKVMGKELEEKEILNEKLGKVRQEKELLGEELSKVNQEKETLEKELGKVRQKTLEAKKTNSIDAKEWDKVRQEKEILEEELTKVNQEKETLEKELDKVRQKRLKAKKTNSIDVPKNVDGWGVQRKGDYYRLFKKIAGRVKWIHVGKEWDLEIAKKKIAAFKQKAKKVNV